MQASSLIQATPAVAATVKPAIASSDVTPKPAPAMVPAATDRPVASTSAAPPAPATTPAVVPAGTTVSASVPGVAALPLPKQGDLLAQSGFPTRPAHAGEPASKPAADATTLDERPDRDSHD
jgi:hypothetical protein